MSNKKSSAALIELSIIGVILMLIGFIGLTILQDNDAMIRCTMNFSHDVCFSILER